MLKGLYWCCNSHLILGIEILGNIPRCLLQCVEFILSYIFLLFISGNLNTSESFLCIRIDWNTNLYFSSLLEVSGITNSELL